MQSSMKRRGVRSLVSRARFARAIVAITCAGVFTASCGDKETSDPTAGVLTTMTVSPGTQTLAINGTQQFTAAGKDVSGTAVAITPTWSIVAGGGTISSAGMFTAGTTSGTFTATVKATSGSVTAKNCTTYAA